MRTPDPTVLAELGNGPATTFELSAVLDRSRDSVFKSLRKWELRGRVKATMVNGGWQVGKRYLWELAE